MEEREVVNGIESQQMGLVEVGDGAVETEIAIVDGDEGGVGGGVDGLREGVACAEAEAALELHIE